MDCVLEGVARPHPSRDKRTQLLVCGTNKKFDTKFRLPYPITSVKSCRLMWASVPGVSQTTTAAYVKIGGQAINKVHTAIPVNHTVRPPPPPPADPPIPKAPNLSTLDPLDFQSGRSHFFVIPNSVETYVPVNETDETVLFSPELSNVTEIEVELYPLPNPTRELLDLSNDSFSMLLELVSSHR